MMKGYLEQIPSGKKKLYCFSKIEKETKIDFFGEDIIIILNMKNNKSFPKLTASSRVPSSISC